MFPKIDEEFGRWGVGEIERMNFSSFTPDYLIPISPRHPGKSAKLF